MNRGAKWYRNRLSFPHSGPLHRLTYIAGFDYITKITLSKIFPYLIGRHFASRMSGFVHKGVGYLIY